MSKSKSIYVVTMENDEMDAVEIGYASSSQIADKMMTAISSTDGFENNTYKSFKAPIDYMEINDESVCFEENAEPANDDLLVQFAMLWGMKIGSVSSDSEINNANHMKSYDSSELYILFSAWKEEYITQEWDDTVDFFEEKMTEMFSVSDVNN